LTSGAKRILKGFLHRDNACSPESRPLAQAFCALARSTWAAYQGLGEDEITVFDRIDDNRKAALKTSNTNRPNASFTLERTAATVAGVANSATCFQI